MKVLISILVGLLVVGCGGGNQGEPGDTIQQPVAKEIVVEDFVGTYGVVDPGPWGPARLVFLEKGVGEYHNTATAGSEVIRIKWKIVKKGFVQWECNISGHPFSAVYRHNLDGSITGGMGTFKKIKSEKETPSKGEEKTSPSIVLEGKAPDTLAAQLVALSPGINEIKVEHDGQSRRLIVTTPKTFSRQNLYPILFCFHGAGGKADGPSKRWSPHADKRDLIVISVEAVQPLSKWNFRDKFHAEEHDDVGLILKVVEALIATKTGDPKTIYATGHSSGGLFCYRLAKEVAVFAAFSPMSCGMVKGAHDPDEKTKLVPILQVIGDQDKSFNGSQNPKVTMYSAVNRIDVWRKFNRCDPDPVVIEKGKEIIVLTYVSQSGIEVALCKVKDQGHFIRRDLRDIADSLALDFLLKHKKNTK